MNNIYSRQQQLVDYQNAIVGHLEGGHHFGRNVRSGLTGGSEVYHGVEVRQCFVRLGLTG